MAIVRCLAHFLDNVSHNLMHLLVKENQWNLLAIYLMQMMLPGHMYVCSLLLARCRLGIKTSDLCICSKVIAWFRELALAYFINGSAFSVNCKNLARTAMRKR